MAAPPPLDYQAGSDELRVHALPWGFVAMLAGVACLLGVGVLTTRHTPGPDRRTVAGMQTVAVKAGLDKFAADTGRYPTQGEGLNALMVAPAGLATWKGPYLPGHVLKDPWGRAIIYTAPPKDRSKDPYVFSTGPDGIQGTPDDISLAR
jgi:general secretion pathway protein G